MAASQEYLMKVKLQLEAQQLEQQLTRVQGKLENLGGGKMTKLGDLLGDANNQWGSFGSIVDTVTGKLSTIPVPAAAAAGAIAGIGIAAYGAAKELLDLAKQGSDFGRQLGSFESKTGLSAAAVSTLAYNAKLSNKELSDLQRPLVSFAKYVEKSGGNVKDLDGELNKAILKLNEMPDGIEKMNAAGEMFGKRGGLEMINLAKKMPGGFEEAKRAAERLGVTLSEDDVRAAKEFGRAWDTISYQIEVGTAKFALAYAPQITGAIHSISDALAKNQNYWHAWGSTVGSMISGAIKALSTVSGWISSHPLAARIILGVGTFGMSEAGFLAAQALDQAGGGASTSGGGGHRNTSGYSAEGSNAPYRHTSTGGDDEEDDDSKGGGGRGRIHKAPKESDSEFRKFFEDRGFKVNRTQGEALNPGSPHTYGGAADISVKAKTITDIFELMVDAIQKGYRVVDETGKNPAPGIKRTGPNLHVENAKTTLTKGSIFSNEQLTPDQVAYLKNLDSQRLGKTKQGEFQSFQKKNAEDVQKAQQDELDGAQKVVDAWIREERDAMDARLSIRKNEADMAEEILKGQLQAGMISETQYADTVGQLKIDMLQNERDELADQISTQENINKLKELDLQIETAKLKKENDILEILRKQREEVDKAQKKNQRPGTMTLKHRGDKQPGFADSVFGTIGTEKFKDQGDMMTATLQKLGDVGGQAINSLAGAMGSLVENWVLYGAASDGGAKKAIASALAMAASQSAVSAIMETAYGIAALTPWGAAIYGPAALHFKSAALFAAVAVGTGLAGRAVAGKSFSNGSGGSGGGSSSAGGTSATASPNVTSPYTRQDPTAYYSGRNNNFYAQAIQDLNNKISSMRPGDVLTVGMRQSPGAVGSQAVKDMRSNSSIATDMKRVTGAGPR